MSATEAQASLSHSGKTLPGQVGHFQRYLKRIWMQARKTIHEEMGESSEGESCPRGQGRKAHGIVWKGAALNQ